MMLPTHSASILVGGFTSAGAVIISGLNSKNDNLKYPSICCTTRLLANRVTTVLGTFQLMGMAFPSVNFQSDSTDKGYVRKSNENSELSGEIVHLPVTIPDSSNIDWRRYG